MSIGKARQHASVHRQRHVQARKASQGARIERGLADGSLTKAEADKAKGRQSVIDAKLGAFMKDGRLDAREARTLERMQNAADKQIGWLRNNGTRATTPGLDKRIQNFEGRLEAAKSDPNINSIELARLGTKLNALKNDKATMGQDGAYTEAERATLVREANALDRAFRHARVTDAVVPPEAPKP